MLPLDALDTPDLAPLWHAVHHRLSSGRPVVRVRVGPLDERQRTALADLLGTDRLPGEFHDVRVALLDELLLALVGVGLREALASLVGPLGDRSGQRAESARERAGLWDWLFAHPVVAAQPALADWAEATRRSGVLGGAVERTRAELDRVLRVVSALPATGEPLPVLADRLLGDPHALDDGSRCSGSVLRALAVLYGIDPPEDAGARRELWQRAGVVADELSPVVLTTGLSLPGSGIGAVVLRACADAGEVAALTLAQVRTLVPGAVPDRVWVFENPSVLAVASRRFGRECHPIVCTSGWPNSAVTTLLQLLADSGAELAYHGDLDGEGVRIAAHVRARTGAVPWRMTGADYLAALHEDRDGPPVGRVTPAPWAPELAPLMAERGTAVTEERVADLLLDEIHDPGTVVGPLS